MRCKLCDFSEEGVQSFYNQGLQHRGRVGKRRYVTLDKQTGEYICTVCEEETRLVQLGLERIDD